MVRQGKITTIAAILSVSPLLFAADKTSAPELNRAQQLVFIEDHLQGIPEGSSLHYDFSSETKGLESYSDRVKITVTEVVGKAKRNLEFDFLSGDHYIDFSPAVGYTGNPVIIHFLERDIARMARETGASYGYFRNRIRNAFRRPAQLRDIKISLQGKELEAVEVAIEPFISDPNIANYAIYARKRYEFTFSEQVPGGVYRIQSFVPGEKGSGHSFDEMLTFHELIPAI